MEDPYNLQRFTDAQDTVYADVLIELKHGQKRSHWMWFIFPQLKGLGRTDTARHFGIASLQEARAYLDHAVLGPRLRECTRLVLQIEGRSAHQMFGSPDDLKFRSCLSLFAAAAPEGKLFQDALDKFYAGEPDPLTAAALGISKPG